MVSLYFLVKSLFFQNQIIKVRRVPPLKSLRAIQLGLTIGILSVLVFLMSEPLSSGNSLWQRIGTLIFYLVGTAIGAWFVAILAFLAILGISIFSMTASAIYLAGFAFGALISIFYNDVAYILTVVLRKKDVKIAFFFDPKQKLNIIKSPIEWEMGEQWLKQKKEDKDRLCYYYELEEKIVEPYTIVLIANPAIKVNQVTPQDSRHQQTPRADPILNDCRLFLKAVDDALISFENNSVLGHPDIWPKVRVVAVFEADFDNQTLNNFALAQPYQYAVALDDEKQAENILEPAESYFETYMNIVGKIADNADIPPKIRESNVFVPLREEESRMDIIFVLSASQDYTRPTCWPSIVDDPSNAKGIKFCFIPYAPESKSDELKCQDLAFTQKPIEAVHEYFVNKPGVAAINVLTASTMTYIHEFGHAMASPKSGAIVDEYYDSYETVPLDGSSEKLGATGATTKSMIDPISSESLWEFLKLFIEFILKLFNISLPLAEIEGNAFYINRLERVDKNGAVQPVPRVFAKYNGTIYESDIAHPSTQTQWKGFFPARKDVNVTCLMDGYGLQSRFDDLLSQFMYDRLFTKVNRDK